MKKILLFGAGVGSREVLRIIQRLNEEEPTWDVLGFVERDTSLTNKQIEGYPVCGLDHGVSSKDVYAVCGAMDPAVRKRVIEEEIEAKGFQLPSIIHPDVFMPKDFVTGPGTIIYPGVNISFNVKLGKAAFVFYNVLLGHDLSAGDYVTILPSATINGGCSIGDECTIGSGATLHPGISIGNNSIVGIGTTLVETIEEGKSVVDFPRKVIKDRF